MILFKWLSFLVLLGLCAGRSSAARFELLDYNAVANPSAVFVSVDGWARFTVLTSRVIRLEYASSAGEFEDRPTVPILNRYFANVPSGTQLLASNGTVLQLETSDVWLSYQVGSGPFSATNLVVKSRNVSSGFSSWNPSMTNSNSNNLLGTIRSLDLLGVVPLNCTENAHINVHHESLHCAWGLIGRQGFAVVDDTDSWALNSTTYWWDSPNRAHQDWYLFAHGLDYKSALQDFVSVAGRIAMPPRYASGIMYTRWFNYDSADLRRVVEAYSSRSLPLDVLILDMDWHTKFGWGTYTVDARLFQYPADAFQWVREQGLATSLNLHDNNGVIVEDKMYEAFARSLGIFEPSSTATIPFSIVNSTYMFNLEDVVLQDLLDVGAADFWWIDWQQGGTAGGASGHSQNPTYMLNHVRATDSMRKGLTKQRDMVLGRFGGLGNHRYQVGFSGDVLGVKSLPEEGLSWRNLAFQPYFSWTATNVGFGFWSHDLVGPRYDHELHTRWLQWGANSAVFRTHDRGMSSGYCEDVSTELCAVVRVYNVPLRFFEINRACMRRREAWVPYIYQQYRTAYDTGLSIVRPMYYDYPHEDLAYAGNEHGDFAQYFFGPDIIVAPVVTRSDNVTGMAAKSVWLPPGLAWFELDTGRLFQGGANTVLTKNYDLSEVPTFVRAGAILPSLVLDRLPSLNGVARQQYSILRFSIYPSATTSSSTSTSSTTTTTEAPPSGSYQLYEDDGATTGYVNAEYVVTTLDYAYTSANRTTLKLSISSEGAYSEFPASRDYELLVVSALPPSAVLLNGATTSLPFLRYRRLTSTSTGYWTYLGNEVSLLIVLPTLSTASPIQVQVEFPIATTATTTAAALEGMKGAFFHAMLAKQHLDQAGSTPGTHTTAGGYLDLTASSGDALSFLAGHNLTAFMKRVDSFSTLYQRTIDEVAALHAYTNGTLLQLYSQDSQDSLLCTSTTCIRDDHPLKYFQIRIEGFFPSTVSGPGLLPLNTYYNEALQDHLVTTASAQAVPEGYLPSKLPPAYVFSSAPGPQALPLSLWYHPLRQDHLTVASPAGVDFAKYWGYQLVNASLGFVLAQASSTSTREYVPPDRQSYAMSLLTSVFVSQP